MTLYYGVCFLPCRSFDRPYTPMRLWGAERINFNMESFVKLLDGLADTVYNMTCHVEDALARPTSQKNYTKIIRKYLFA